MERSLSLISTDTCSVYLNLNRILPCTEAEGPGKRFCLWVQGCQRLCPDCCNQEMQVFEPRLIISVADIWDQIIKSKQSYNIEGITFLGGEPILQAKGLYKLAKLCKNDGLSVLVFTGYTYDELTSNELNIECIADLLQYTDVLIDGPYMNSKPDFDRNWIGSKNQEFHYLTDRYNSTIEKDERYRNLVDITFKNDHIYVSGCPKIITGKKGN